MNAWSMARAKIVEILTRKQNGTHLTLACGRVYDTPSPPPQDGSSEIPRPYIDIYEEAESVIRKDSGTETRETGIAIELVCDKQADLDILREQVQYLLFQTENLEKTISYVQYKSGTPGYSDPNQPRIFTYALRLSVQYEYEPVADASTLDAWKTASVRYENYSLTDAIDLPQ